MSFLILSQLCSTEIIKDLAALRHQFSVEHVGANIIIQISGLKSSIWVSVFCKKRFRMCEIAIC